jgi:hypothetical protein
MFLQAAVVLAGIVTLVIMIRLPLLEGRAKDADLHSIYPDPLILYVYMVYMVYMASIAFFIALYKAFRLLGYIGQNKVFSSAAAGTLRSIKHCSIVLGILIVIAGIYIRIFHAKDDDPAGFIAMCMVAVFISIVVAIAAAIFENILQAGMDLKSENEQLYGQLNK